MQSIYSTVPKEAHIMRRRAGGADPGRIATVFLLIVIVVAVIWLASAGASGNAVSNIITSLFKSNNTPDPSASPGVQTPTPSQEVSSNKITQTLQYPPFSIYAVQLGAFSEQANAVYQSQAVKTQGAAGYILLDQGLYRILATVFYEEADARSVKDNLLAQDIDACVKPLVIDGLTLNITATAEQIAAIKAAHDQWLATAQALAQIDRGYDSKIMTRQQVSSNVSDAILALKTAREAAQLAAAGSAQVDLVCAELLKTETELQKLTDPSLTDSMLSADIKHCLIDMVYRFGQYAQQISTQ